VKSNAVYPFLNNQAIASEIYSSKKITVKMAKEGPNNLQKSAGNDFSFNFRT
jgi:hypothetical protein